MSDNINKTYDISNVKGPIVLRDSFGNRTYYNNATSAMAANPGNYYVPMSSNGLKNYQVQLPSVDVVGYKPDYKEDDLKTLTDPVRDRIFQGYYNGRKFEPTSENISHYLKLYKNDKKVNKGYGWHLWGELAAIEAAATTGIGTLFMIARHNPDKVAAIKLKINEIPKRAIETTMRTSYESNALPIIKYNIRSMLNGENGGIPRLSTIGRYILFGSRTGPKGYYNSFSIEKSPSLGKTIGIKNAADSTYGYTGFMHVGPTDNVNDIIDAYLYGKTIDPRTGLKRVDNNDLEIFTDYVNKYYPKKRSKILVYETRPQVIELTEDINKSSLKGVDYGINMFRTNEGVTPDVAGHMLQVVTGVNSSKKYCRDLDIWKFQPDDYYKKWLKPEDNSTLQPKPVKLPIKSRIKSQLMKALLYRGLKAVDDAGTPIIFKAPWLRYYE